MPAADVEFLVHAAQRHLPGPGRGFIETFYIAGGDQGVAVDAQEALAELLLQIHQRILDQVFLARRARHDVLRIGDEIHDVGHRHQADVAAHVHADVGARRRLLARLVHFLELLHGELARLGERVRQPVLADRLQQIIHGVDLERVERVLVVGGGEDHARRVLHAHQVHGRLEAVHARHADVHQQHVGVELGGHFHRLGAVGGLADDGIAADVGDQLAQPLARQFLVIHDQDSHASPPRSGSTTVTV